MDAAQIWRKTWKVAKNTACSQTKQITNLVNLRHKEESKWQWFDLPISNAIESVTANAEI